MASEALAAGCGHHGQTPAAEVVKLVVAFVFKSSRLFGSFGLLGLRRIWVEVHGVDEAPIAGLG